MLPETIHALYEYTVRSKDLSLHTAVPDENVIPNRSYHYYLVGADDVLMM